MLFSFFLMIILFIQRNCQNTPSDYIGHITDILVDLISEAMTLSIDKALNASIKNGNQTQIDEMKKCKEAYEIFNKEYEYGNKDDLHYQLRRYYTTLIYQESSKSKNNLGEYTDCIENQNIDLTNVTISEELREEIRKNSTYTIFRIYEKSNKPINDFRFKDNEYLFGLCLKKGCSEESIKTMFYEFNKEIILFEKLNDSNITIYNLESGRQYVQYERMIPIFIIILFALFDFIAWVLRTKCLREHSKIKKFFELFTVSDNFKKILGDKNEMNKEKLNIIRGVRGIMLISLVISTSFFYIYHLPTKVFNQENMENLLKSWLFPLIYHGERFARKILFSLSGIELTYRMLEYLDGELKNKTFSKNDNLPENAPIIGNESGFESECECETEKEKENEINKNVQVEENKMINVEDDDEEEEEKKEENNIINERIKKMPMSKEEEYYNKILDDWGIKNNQTINPKNSSNNISEIVEEDKKDEIIKEKETKGNIDINSVKNETPTPENEENNFEEEIEGGKNLNIDEDDYYEKYRKTLKMKELLFWYLKRIYKILLFLLAMYVFKFGAIYPFMLMQNTRPIWRLYFDDISNAFSHFQILGNLCFFSSFISEAYFWLNPFGIVSNEILFFIIGSCLIFICYRFRFRLDIIILVLFSLFSLGKLIFAIVAFYKYDIEDLNFYPAMFFQNDNKYIHTRNYFLTNPLFMINLFLLGMFFGEIFYCINNNESNDKDRNYLLLPKKFVSSKLFDTLKEINLCKTIVILLIPSILYIAIVYAYQIFIYVFMWDNNNPDYFTFFSNKTFNFVSLLDGDLGAIVLLLIIFILFFSKDVIFSGFLEHKFWRIIYMPYWSNLLLLHICASFNFYYSENRIKLAPSSVIFLGFQIFILLTISACFFFILIERPCKKINRFLVDGYKDPKEDETGEEEESKEKKEKIISINS